VIKRIKSNFIETLTPMQEIEEDEEEELFEHHRVIVDKGQSSMRVDKFLFSKYEQISRNRIQNAIELKAVKVNDLATKASYKVKPYDVIVFSLPKPPRDFEIIPQNIPLNY
jgi:23S rRNA pseudouridine1911/1915/1917 synthase